MRILSKNNYIIDNLKCGFIKVTCWSKKGQFILFNWKNKWKINCVVFIHSGLYM